MTFVKVRPSAKRFPAMTDDFDRLFNDLFYNGSSINTNHKPGLISRPTVNIIENDGSYVLELAAPGLEKEDFEISVEKEVMTISVAKDLNMDETARFKRREFGNYQFKRSFRLPDTINTEAIEAKYEAGVLKLALPVKEEVAPKRIEIA